ncbi:hypothetical protein NGB36_17180 [Streptomyces sp. RB6PN25]|uniref:DUF6542 domain-containing protein n=1 Tax=Streptomyces humicola TaxID=2953240 RepID=A0ABT1PX81_9ACTN|nr:DUF6542 domain-containing protein [Streptomyces humicola]MCQ4082293.1 hypothetical protein [Streptomyces humicola]
MDHPRTRTSHPSRAAGSGGRPPAHGASASGASAARSATVPSDGPPVDTATVYRTRAHRGGHPAHPGTLLSRIVHPSARLTGFGTGVVITSITLAGGAIDSWLFNGPGVFFGLVFVAASIAGALWVRRYDLAAAPVSAPIAFALALVFTGDSGSGGIVGHLMGTVTGLATHTVWLYAGTILAAVVAVVRKFAGRPPPR